METLDYEFPSTITFYVKIAGRIGPQTSKYYAIATCTREDTL